jgi:hypothetical protein
VVERHCLKLEILRGADVAEFRTFLHDLERAYLALYRGDDVLEELVFLRPRLIGGRSRRRWHWPTHEGEIYPDDRLALEKININSPGAGVFSGLGEPIESLRKYLGDRHERSKDKEWRNATERKKAELENELLEAQVDQAKIGTIKAMNDTLEAMGVPPDERQRIIWNQFGGALTKLGRHQDTGLIGGPVKDDGRGPKGPRSERFP